MNNLYWSIMRCENISQIKIMKSYNKFFIFPRQIVMDFERRQDAVKRQFIIYRKHWHKTIPMDRQEIEKYKLVCGKELKSLKRG